MLFIYAQRHAFSPRRCRVCLLARRFAGPTGIDPAVPGEMAQGMKWCTACAKSAKSRSICALRGVHYRLIHKLSEVDVPIDAGLYQLIDRAVLDAIRQCPDQYPFIPGLIGHCGFRKTAVEYTWVRRKFSVSKAKWFDMCDQTLNGITSFSRVPLRAAFAAAHVAGGERAHGLVAFVGWLGSRCCWILGLCVRHVFLGGHATRVPGRLWRVLRRNTPPGRPRPIVVERKRLNFDSPPAANADRTVLIGGSRGDARSAA